MKILAIICEFNPLHNGHKYLFDNARKLYGCDFILCIMSGSFTQRGEMCILDKYKRARHAINAGADCVIQLPAPFAVAPAEIFAKGAIKILSSIPDVTALLFGSENGFAESFTSSADLLIDESDLFKKVLNEKLESGESYIKSLTEAFACCGGDREIVSNPNNILGLEYAKAIKRAGANIDIVTLKRAGSGYNESSLCENFSSASAIRNNLGNSTIKNNVPDFVYADLKNAADIKEAENAMRFSLFNSSAEQLKRIYGCGEGIENKLKSLENLPYKEIVENATSKRYSSSRIKRILCANMLGLYREDTEKFFNSDLYIKPLAVNKERADEILSALAKSGYPVVCGVSDENLSETAKQCFDKDKYVYSVYKHLTRTNNKDYMLLV